MMNQSVLNSIVDVGNVGVGAAVSGVSAGLIHRLFMTQEVFSNDIPIFGGTPVWMFIGIAAALSSGVQGALFELLPQVVQNKVASILLQAPMIAAPVITGANMYFVELAFAIAGDETVCQNISHTIQEPDGCFRHIHNAILWN